MNSSSNRRLPSCFQSFVAAVTRMEEAVETERKQARDGEEGRKKEGTKLPSESRDAVGGRSHGSQRDDESQGKANNLLTERGSD